MFCFQDWEKCEKGIGDSLEKLRSFKKKLSQPLPDHHDELHAEQIRCKVKHFFSVDCYLVFACLCAVTSSVVNWVYITDHANQPAISMTRNYPCNIWGP